MDQRVLEAQQWVNATYGNVPGYQRCAENGKTGWATMFSLTRGLQRELGITELSDSFGPTTMSKVAAQGPINEGYTTNANIVRIIQHGLYCKGYDAGETQTGRLHAGTAAAVRSLKTNMGLTGTDGTVIPKVFKAILNMDAYVMLAGGRQQVQNIQRWLNGKYHTRSTFFIIPCDGIYSRDVQKALMTAIQYQIGIPDDSATGNFGPGTQAGLRANPVGSGSSQSWIELFSAACVFNSPIRRPDVPGGGRTEATFQSRWDADLSDWIRQFQRFSVLEPTGTGNYQTWAQLLVSTGDPDRSVSACDTSKHILGDRGPRLHNAGYRVVGRYLDESPNETLNKELQPGELAAIFAAGLRVFPISQYWGRGLSDFSWSKGYDHALLAHDRAVGYGFNAGTVIYFAVDYDATGEEITSNIVPYFNGVAAGLRVRGGRYIQGVYGSRNVCSRVSSESYARHSFVSGMSREFSGNLGFPMPDNWAFTQIKEFDFQPSSSDPFALDNNVMRGTDPGCASVSTPASPLDAFVAFIRSLYTLAVEYGGDANNRVLEYMRFPKYDGFWRGWDTLIGPVDRNWIAYVDARLQPVREFIDPATRIPIALDHFAATAQTILREGTGGSTGSNRGDFGGWGGDLCTLYGEWRKAEASYASGYQFVEARFAKINVESTFALTDYIQDCDGHMIGTTARAGGKIDDLIVAYVTGTGPATRFRQFYQNRHGGTVQNVFNAAKSMLTDSTGDPELAGLKTAAMTLQAGEPITLPTQLPAYKLDPFVQGYADAVDRLSRG